MNVKKDFMEKVLLILSNEGTVIPLEVEADAKYVISELGDKLGIDTSEVMDRPSMEDDLAEESFIDTMEDDREDVYGPFPRTVLYVSKTKDGMEYREREIPSKKQQKRIMSEVEISEGFLHWELV